MTMKKMLTALALFLTLGMASNAQGVYQIPNSDFSSWAKANEPGNGWYSFPSAGGKWENMAGSSPAPTSDTDRSGDPNSKSCKIWSKNLTIAKANGNLTTGRVNMGSTTPSSSSNYNFTDRSGSNKLLFAGRPDAVEFYAKFTSGGSPNGRGQFILHGDVDYRDPEISDQASYKVGIASVLIPASTDWVRYEGTFTYSQQQPATQYMLASFTTNPTPGGSANDYLWIDDVRLIYYHALSALSYQGATLNFSENTLNYDLSSVEYDASKLSYTKKGVGATVEQNYNETNHKLTITVKGNDYSVNNSSVTTYSIQFAAPATPEPEPEPEPEPNPNPGEAQPLGGKVMSLDNIDMSKAYLLRNPASKAYAVYSPDNHATNVWAAEAEAWSDKWVASNSYAQELDSLSANSSWMVIKKDNGVCLYNLGAKKYLTTPSNTSKTKPCTFSESEVVLQYVDLGDGKFAFTVTTEGNDKDYACVDPRRAEADGPISVWTSSDDGSAWELYENPNVAVDSEKIPVLPLGNALTSLEDLDMTKTYVIYNEAYTTYATYNSTYSEDLWSAGMISGDADHQVSNENYSVALDLKAPGCSWMLLKDDANYYLYNMGAQKYLVVASFDEEGFTQPCSFSENQSSVSIVELGEGKFAFTTTGEDDEYMCTSPQSEYPISIWQNSDSGAQWKIIENPNVEADLDLMATVTGIATAPVVGNTVKGIFTLSGVRVNVNAVEQLPAGLYIVNGKKRFVK